MAKAPQDSTMRNVRAANAKIAKLKARFDVLELELLAIKERLALAGIPRKVSKP